MIVRDRLRKPADDAADGPELHEVNCRVCGKFEKPWVWYSCKKCGITGEVRKEIVRRFEEEQARTKGES